MDMHRWLQVMYFIGSGRLDVRHYCGEDSEDEALTWLDKLDLKKAVVGGREEWGGCFGGGEGVCGGGGRGKHPLRQRFNGSTGGSNHGCSRIMECSSTPLPHVLLPPLPQRSDGSFSTATLEASVQAMHAEHAASKAAGAGAPGSACVPGTKWSIAASADSRAPLIGEGSGKGSVSGKWKVKQGLGSRYRWDGGCCRAAGRGERGGGGGCGGGL